MSSIYTVDYIGQGIVQDYCNTSDTLYNKQIVFFLLFIFHLTSNLIILKPIFNYR